MGGEEKGQETAEGFDSCNRASLEGTEFSANAGRKGGSGSMSRKTLRLNAMRATISDQEELGYAPFLGLSTYSHNPQRERKKGAKKERETATTLFLSNRTFLSGEEEDISIGA